MLGIVLAGITALGVTHYLGMKNMRRPRRRQLSRILWVEALTKSKLARFVGPNKCLEKGKKKNCKAYRRGRPDRKFSENQTSKMWSWRFDLKKTDTLRISASKLTGALFALILSLKMTQTGIKYIL